MKITTIIVSSNENPEYYKFFGYIKPIWDKLLKARTMLIYVGHAIPDELLPYKDDIIIYVPPKTVPEIHTAFIAQTVRLLYPSLLPTMHESDGILITDVDCIPMSSDYFIKQVENISDDKFINYSFDPAVFACKEHNIPYSLATGKVWKEIFQINSLEDVNQRIIDWNIQNGKYHFDGHYRSKCVGFHFDQQILYKYLEDWNKLTGRLVLFNLSERKRFLPADFANVNNPDVQRKIKEGYYVDNFFLRPYKKKKAGNDLISKLLLSGPV